MTIEGSYGLLLRVDVISPTEQKYRRQKRDCRFQRTVTHSLVPNLIEVCPQIGGLRCLLIPLHVPTISNSIRKLKALQQMLCAEWSD